MSARALRWLLCLAAVVALPLPVFGIASARLPPLHTLELGGLALAFTWLERAQGIGPLLSALLLGQALAYAAGLWLAAGLAARALSRLPPHPRTRAAFFLVVLGLALAIAQPIYRTPYSARAANSSLLEVYR